MKPLTPTQEETRMKGMERIYGPPAAADDSITIRCSGACGEILTFDRWNKDGPEFYGELYTGFQPALLRERMKAAWTCLRGRERTANGIVLDEESARALGAFLSTGA